MPTSCSGVDGLREGAIVFWLGGWWIEYQRCLLYQSPNTAGQGSSMEIAWKLINDTIWKWYLRKTTPIIARAHPSNGTQRVRSSFFQHHVGNQETLRHLRATSMHKQHRQVILVVTTLLTMKRSICELMKKSWGKEQTLNVKHGRTERC